MNIILCSVPVETPGYKLRRARSKGRPIMPKSAICSLNSWAEKNEFTTKFYDIDMLYPSDEEIEKVCMLELLICNRCMQKKNQSETLISRCLRGAENIENVSRRKVRMPGNGREVLEAMNKETEKSKKRRLQIYNDTVQTTRKLRKLMQRIFNKRISKAIKKAKRGKIDKELVKTAVAVLENKPKKREQVQVFKNTASLCRKKHKK